MNNFRPETCNLLISKFAKEQPNKALNIKEFEHLWNFLATWRNHFRDHTNLLSDFDSDRHFVDANQLSKALKSQGYTCLSKEACKLLLRKFDLDNTGALRFDDFLRLSLTLQKVTVLFQRLDFQNSNRVSLEYESFMSVVIQTML